MKSIEQENPKQQSKTQDDAKQGSMAKSETRQGKVQQDRTKQENKMGVMPIDKLLISMSLPMMVSMLVQALYNIVDSIFVSQINEYALRAVSLAFPIQTLMIAVSVGTAVGVNAFLSKTLGEKDFAKANTIAVNGIFIEMVSYIVFALIGIFVSRPFFCQPDGNCRGAGVRNGIFDNLLCGRCGNFYADDFREASAIHWKNFLYHDHSGNRCNRQLDFGSDSYFRIFGDAENGCCRRCDGNGHRTDGSGGACRYL